MIFIGHEVINLQILRLTMRIYPSARSQDLTLFTFSIRSRWVFAYSYSLPFYVNLFDQLIECLKCQFQRENCQVSAEPTSQHCQIFHTFRVLCSIKWSSAFPFNSISSIRPNSAFNQAPILHPSYQYVSQKPQIQVRNSDRRRRRHRLRSIQVANRTRHESHHSLPDRLKVANGQQGAGPLNTLLHPRHRRRPLHPLLH